MANTQERIVYLGVGVYGFRLWSIRRAVMPAEEFVGLVSWYKTSRVLAYTLEITQTTRVG